MLLTNLLASLPVVRGLAVAGLLATGLGLTPGGARAEQPIGTVVRVVNTATADTRPLAVGDGLAESQTIEVRPGALTEIRLNDGTKLAAGPSSRLSLDRFAYDPASPSGTIAMTLRKGAFRFVTGAAAKASYQIRTPNASILLRGTVFDIFVGGNGAEYLMLQEGAVEVCSGDGTDRTRCRLLIDPCQVVRVSPGGWVSRPQPWASRTSDLDLTFSEAFPFVLSPPQIDPVVYHTRADIEGNRCPAPSAAVPAQSESARFEPAKEEPPPGTFLTGSVAETASPARPEQVAASDAAAGEPVRENNEGVAAVTVTGVSAISTGSVDQPRPAGPRPAPTAPAVPLMSSAPDPRPSIWSGFHAGIHGGAVHDSNVDETSFMAGVQGGWQIETRGLVLGIEADISRMDVSGTAVSDGLTLSSGLDWFGTLRARAGVNLGAVLLYGTGGLAFGDVSLGLNGASKLDHYDDFATGWTAGAGAEMAIGDRMSVRAEYLYYDLGTAHLSGLAGEDFDADLSGHIGRAALNFHLN